MMQEQFRLLKPYLRGLPIIVLAMVIGVAAAKKYLSYVTPMYESTAKLKLADADNGVASSNLFKDFDVFVSPNKIAAEIEVLKSQALISKTLDSLDFDIELFRVGRLRTVELYHEAPIRVEASQLESIAYDQRFQLKVISSQEFLLTPPQSPAIQGRFGEPMALPCGQITIQKNAAFLNAKADAALVDQYAFEFLSRERLIAKVIQHLDITSVDKDVAVIRLSFKSPVPQKAADFVNALCMIYVEDYIQEKYRAAQTTVQFLDHQIDTVAARLSTAENVIERFRDDRNIINLPQETETNLRQLSQLKVQQTNLGMSLDGLNDFQGYIASGKEDFLELAPNFEGYSDLLSTEIVKNIKRLQGDRRDLRVTYTEQDERVKVIDKKIDDLKSYLIEGIDNSKQMLSVKYDRLTQDIRTAESQFVGIPTKEKNMTILNREFSLVQQSYNFLNAKKMEAEIAQAAKVAFHRILSQAAPSSKPVSPNRTIIVIVAALLGMLGSIGAIGLVHFAKGKVNDTQTIEKASAIPVSLTTPYFKEIGAARRHFLKEAIQLEIKGIVNDSQRLIVLSSQSSGEGRSFHALMLAEAFARQGRRVLLLDASEGAGLVQLDLAKWGFDGAALPEGRDRYNKLALQQLLDRHLANYELVILNNEQMDEETVGLMLMSLAHTNLFILDARKTPAKQIVGTELLAQEFQLPSMGFVLNRAGYSPNVLSSGFNFLKRLIGRGPQPLLP